MTKKPETERKPSKPEHDIVAPREDLITSHGYFHGHECHLPAEKISSYNIKTRGLRRMLFNLITVHAGDIRAMNLYRSYAALCEERSRHYKYYCYVIHPFSKFRFYLEVLFVFIMLLASFLVAHHYSESGPTRKGDYHEHLLIFCDFMIVLNIISNFFTGVIEGFSNKVANLSLDKIAWKYIRSWLAVDVAACIGITFEFFYIDYITPRLLLEAMKLIRLPIILGYLRNILTVMRVPIFQKSAVEISFLLLIYVPWNIYFQFSVEYAIEGSYFPANPRKCSWLTIGKLWNQTHSVRLLYAFDRTVDMLTTNINSNIIEIDCFETFHLIAWLVSKICVFHFALKYMLSLFGTESARANYYIMTKQLETYMAQRNFPPRLKKKILKFYAIRFQSKYFEESRMLGCVSGQLREDILMHTGRQLVRELKFLKQLPSSLLVQIACKLKVVIFIAGDIIFKINTVGRQVDITCGKLTAVLVLPARKGAFRNATLVLSLTNASIMSGLITIKYSVSPIMYVIIPDWNEVCFTGDCLYFIDRGTVAIYSDSAKEICHLEDGDFFGEIALVMKHHFRTASAIAVTNCELFRLDREHFESTIAYYPTVYNSIKEVATSRFERTSVLDEHHKAEVRTTEAYFYNK